MHIVVLAGDEADADSLFDHCCAIAGDYPTMNAVAPIYRRIEFPDAYSFLTVIRAGNEARLTGLLVDLLFTDQRVGAPMIRNLHKSCGSLLPLAELEPNLRALLAMQSR